MGSENQLQLPLTKPLSPLMSQSDRPALQEECETLRLEVTRLRSALEKERTYRQRVEQHCEIERQRADGYYSDRQDYKQRLREAASAYTQLKDAYLRLRSTPPAINNPIATAPTVAAITSVDATTKAVDEELEGSPTQASLEQQHNLAAPLMTQRDSPQTVTLNKVNIVKVEEIERKKREKKPAQDEEPVVNAINNRERPSSHSRPAWKKAVRRRGDVDNVDKDDDIEEEEDAFLKPQAKKWAPGRSTDLGQKEQTRAAQPVYLPYAAPPPPHFADPNPPREQHQPLPNGAAYKHREVIRKREDREKLEGFECQDCKRFYDALEKWGAVAVGGLPQCQHRANAAGRAADGGVFAAANGAAQQHLQQQAEQTANFRNQLRAGASRHRYLFEPPLTPKGFWDLGFSESPTKKSNQEQEIALPPPQPSSAPDSFNSLG